MTTKQTLRKALLAISAILAFGSVIEADAQQRIARKFSLKLPATHFTGAAANRPAPAQAPRATSHRGAFLLAVRQRAEGIARQGMPYIFGGSSPMDGGMDCSGTMMHLFSSLGFHNIPRASYQQYEWLNAHRTIKHTKTIPANAQSGGLKPGDLIFWGGTYNSGHKVSHVMLYLGQGPDGRHFMFGAKGKDKRGMNGSGVDIFELRSGFHKSLVGYGHVPGSF